MARKSITERIAQLDARKKTLQARLGKQERAADTRRKVLLGAFLLHRIENDREFGLTLRDFVKRELPAFLSREADKALFVDLLGNETSAAAAVTPSNARDDRSDTQPDGENDSLPVRPGATMRPDTVDI